MPHSFTDQWFQWTISNRFLHVRSFSGFSIFKAPNSTIKVATTSSYKVISSVKELKFKAGVTPEKFNQYRLYRWRNRTGLMKQLEAGFFTAFDDEATIANFFQRHTILARAASFGIWIGSSHEKTQFLATGSEALLPNNYFIHFSQIQLKIFSWQLK